MGEVEEHRDNRKSLTLSSPFRLPPCALVMSPLPPHSPRSHQLPATFANSAHISSVCVSEDVHAHVCLWVYARSSLPPRGPLHLSRITFYSADTGGALKEIKDL